MKKCKYKNRLYCSTLPLLERCKYHIKKYADEWVNKHMYDIGKGKLATRHVVQLITNDLSEQVLHCSTCHEEYTTSLSNYQYTCPIELIETHAIQFMAGRIGFSIVYCYKCGKQFHIPDDLPWNKCPNDKGEKCDVDVNTYAYMLKLKK